MWDQGLALKVLRKSGITLAYKSRDMSEQGLQLGGSSALCCLEVMTAPSPGVVGRGQGDTPAPLQFSPALILGKHQGSQSCHARQPQAHVKQWPVPHGQTPLSCGHLMLPSQGSPGSRAALVPHRASSFLAPGFLLFFRGVVLRPQEGHSAEQPGAPGGDKHFVEQPARALCACGTTMAEVGGAGIHRASVHAQGDASVTGPLSCATAPCIT